MKKLDDRFPAKIVEVKSMSQMVVVEQKTTTMTMMFLFGESPQKRRSDPKKVIRLDC